MNSANRQKQVSSLTLWLQPLTKSLNLSFFLKQILSSHLKRRQRFQWVEQTPVFEGCQCPLWHHNRLISRGLYFSRFRGLNCDFCDFKCREQSSEMNLAAARRGEQSDEEQLSWPARGPHVCDWQEDAEQERDRSISGEGTNRPEWFKIGFFGFLLLAASIVAGTHWLHSTNDCIIAYSAPCTMNLHVILLNLLHHQQSEQSKKKQKKNNASPFVCGSLYTMIQACVMHHSPHRCPGVRIGRKAKESVGCDAAEHPGAFNKVAPRWATCSVSIRSQGSLGTKHLCAGAFAEHCSQKQN